MRSARDSDEVTAACLSRTPQDLPVARELLGAVRCAAPHLTLLHLRDVMTYNRCWSRMRNRESTVRDRDREPRPGGFARESHRAATTGSMISLRMCPSRGIHNAGPRKLGTRTEPDHTNMAGRGGICCLSGATMRRRDQPATLSDLTPSPSAPRLPGPLLMGTFVSESQAWARGPSLKPLCSSVPTSVLPPTHGPRPGDALQRPAGHNQRDPRVHPSRRRIRVLTLRTRNSPGAHATKRDENETCRAPRALQAHPARRRRVVVCFPRIRRRVSLTTSTHAWLQVPRSLAEWLAPAPGHWRWGRSIALLDWPDWLEPRARVPSPRMPCRRVNVLLDRCCACSVCTYVSVRLCVPSSCLRVFLRSVCALVRVKISGSTTWAQWQQPW